MVFLNSPIEPTDVSDRPLPRPLPPGDIVVTTTTESIGDDDIPMTYDDDGISLPPDESPAPVRLTRQTRRSRDV